MANNAILKAAIQAVIKQNGNNEITGPVLQQALLSMINSLGANYQFAGIATPETTPGEPDQNVAYIACKPGVYSNFTGETIIDKMVVFLYNGTWQSIKTDIPNINFIAETLSFAIKSYAVTYSYGKNLFDKNSLNPTHGYLNYYGTFIEYDGGRVSDYIPIKAGETYTIKNAYNGAYNCFYDAAGNLLSTISGATTTIVAPQNAAFLRVSTTTGGVADQQVEQGSTSTAYEAYKKEISDPSIQNAIDAYKNVSGGSGYYMGIVDATTTPITTTQKIFYVATTPGVYTHFDNITILSGEIAVLEYANGSWQKINPHIANVNEAVKIIMNYSIGNTLIGYVVGKNKFDKSTVTPGYYLDATGTPVSNQYVAYSDKIPVIGGDKMIATPQSGMGVTYSVFYNANDELVGYVNTATNAFTVPDNAVYMRVSVATSYLDTYQLERGTETTSYESYSRQISDINLRTIVDSFNNIANIIGGKIYLGQTNINVFGQPAANASVSGKTLTMQSNAVNSSYFGAYGTSFAALVGADYVGKQIKIAIRFKLSGDVSHIYISNLRCYPAISLGSLKKETVDGVLEISAICTVPSSWPTQFYVSCYMVGGASGAGIVEMQSIGFYLLENTDETKNGQYGFLPTVIKELVKSGQQTYKETLIYCYRKNGVDDSTHFYGLYAIANALNSITDASENNRYTLIIDGVFHFTDPLDLTMYDGTEYSVVYAKPWVSLRGLGQDKTIIFVDFPAGATFHPGKNWYDYQPIYIDCGGDVSVSNMSILGKNCRYAFHLELGSANARRFIKNCRVIHYGLDGYQNAGFAHGFGTGMGVGHIWDIEDCYIEGVQNACFAMHSVLGTTDRQGCVNFKNCTFVGKSLTFGAYPNLSDLFVNFVGCDFQTQISAYTAYRANLYKNGDYMTTKLKVSSLPKPYGNATTTRGIVLRVDALNENADVRFGENSSAFEIIVGDKSLTAEILTAEAVISQYGYFRRDGTAGFAGFAYGSIDIDENTGTGRTLGTMLGDCSVNNKSLVIIVGGTTYTVVFNEDYTAKNNAYVLGKINDVIGAVATATEFAPGKEYYPEFDGLTMLNNIESTPIMRGMGVVRSGSGIRKATNADGYIDGIAMDTVGQNQPCRVILGGQLWSAYYGNANNVNFCAKETANTSREIGAAAGISETQPGIFDVNATPKVLRAKEKDIWTIL